MNRDYIRANRILTDEERIDLQRHPVIGEQEVAKRGLSRAVQLLVRWHHEWWNGMGYPDALEREQIPLAARILRVADTYCALPIRGPITRPSLRLKRKDISPNGRDRIRPEDRRRLFNSKALTS